MHGEGLYASSVTLAWDPSADGDVTGYRLYQGWAPRTYTNVVDVGHATIASLTGLVQGETYFFAVTAYDVIGQESDFSNDLRYTVPTPASSRLEISLTSESAITVTATGPAGAVFDILTSTNLLDWSWLGTVTLDAEGTAEYTNPVPPVDGESRFYRLQRRTAPFVPGAAMLNY